MTQRNFVQMKRRVNQGFTLVEILIVVVILGILAAIVIPQFNSSASQARDSSLRTNLKTIRLQIELYRAHHNDVPGLDSFKAQLTSYTDIDGNTNATKTNVFKFGPYLQAFPDNPLTSSGTISTGDAGDSDWYYDPDSGTFLANNSEEMRTY